MSTVLAQNTQGIVDQNTYVPGAAKRNWALTKTCSPQKGTVLKIQ